MKSRVFKLIDGEWCCNVGDFHESFHETRNDADVMRRTVLAHYYYNENINDRKARQALANRKYLDKQKEKNKCERCGAQRSKYAKHCVKCASFLRRKHNKGEK